jgi:hypothetical protein
MRSVYLIFFVIFAVCLRTADSFMRTLKPAHSNIKPLRENFFLDIAEDPAVNTPKQIFGEVAYKSFVEDYNPNALLLGGEKYDIISRIRELKLLSATADVGLLDALERKGLTLSKLEKFLPLIDSYGLLPLLSKNKDFVLSLAPLLIEPAPSLLPLVVSVVKTPPSSFSFPGALLVGGGLFEAYDHNLLLGVPLVLFGLPMIVLGSVLSGIDIPTPLVSVDLPVQTLSSRPNAVVVKEEKSTPPKVAAAAPRVTKVAGSPKLNGKRKTIKIK